MEIARTPKNSIKFLSTPSARRATRAALPLWSRPPYFYPRPPRGGRLVLYVGGNWDNGSFLSTPSARRATRRISSTRRRLPYFYPRPPRGGRHGAVDDPKDITTFLSTPSARRATTARAPTLPPTPNFYPRPPRGGRLDVDPETGEIIDISIHALREEGDSTSVGCVTFWFLFLSTPSARRATRRCRPRP